MHVTIIATGFAQQGYQEVMNMAGGESLPWGRGAAAPPAPPAEAPRGGGGFLW